MNGDNYRPGSRQPPSARQAQQSSHYWPSHEPERYGSTSGRTLEPYADYTHLQHRRERSRGSYPVQHGRAERGSPISSHSRYPSYHQLDSLAGLPQQQMYASDHYSKHTERHSQNVDDIKYYGSPDAQRSPRLQTTSPSLQSSFNRYPTIPNEPAFRGSRGNPRSRSPSPPYWSSTAERTFNSANHRPPSVRENDISASKEESNFARHQLPQRRLSGARAYHVPNSKHAFDVTAHRSAQVSSFDEPSSKETGRELDTLVSTGVHTPYTKQDLQSPSTNRNIYTPEEGEELEEGEDAEEANQHIAQDKNIDAAPQNYLEQKSQHLSASPAAPMSNHLLMTTDAQGVETIAAPAPAVSPEEAQPWPAVPTEPDIPKLEHEAESPDAAPLSIEDQRSFPEESQTLDDCLEEFFAAKVPLDHAAALLQAKKVDPKHVSARLIIRDITNVPLSSQGRKTIAFLIQAEVERDVQLEASHADSLRTEYRALDHSWKRHCEKMEGIRKRHQRKAVPHYQAIGNSTLSAMGILGPRGQPFDGSIGSLNEEAVTQTPGTAGLASSASTPGLFTGRQSRRGAASAYGDIVRSEAEFLEILATLESADMQDPLTRAARTAAVVPDMVLRTDPERVVHSVKDSNRLINNPEEYYGVYPLAASRHDSSATSWTDEEVSIFCRKYATYPKQFGKIAVYLPNKTTQQCILFYYRSKRSIDFRNLADRRLRDGRKKKPRLSGLNKGSMLLSNLASTKPLLDRGQSPPPTEDPAPSPGAARSLADFVLTDLKSAQEAGAGDAATRRVLGGVTKRSEMAQQGPTEDCDDQLTGSNSPMPLALLQGDEADDGDFDPLGETSLVKKRKLPREMVTNEDDENGKMVSRKRTNTSSFWSAQEKVDFTRLLGIHGRNYVRIAEDIPNKSAVQCRNFFANNHHKLGLDAIAAAAPGGGQKQGVRGKLIGEKPHSEQSATTVASGMSREPSTEMQLALDAPFAEIPTQPARAPGMQLRDLLNQSEDASNVNRTTEQDWFSTPDEEDLVLSPSRRSAAAIAAEAFRPPYPAQADLPSQRGRESLSYEARMHMDIRDPLSSSFPHDQRYSPTRAPSDWPNGRDYLPEYHSPYHSRIEYYHSPDVSSPVDYRYHHHRRYSQEQQHQYHPQMHPYRPGPYYPPWQQAPR